tara:strand:+ start:14628 stop:15731 length:1104 start_codon:yes stop_codon:yes gene_type:complete
MAYSDNFVADLLVLVTDLVSGEKMEMSELLYAKSFMDSDIAESNEIVTGVRHGNVVPILKDIPQPETFAFVDETSCAVTDTPVTNTFASHTWELGLIEARVGICLRSFNENFLKFFNAYRNTQAGGEPVNLDSALLQFISGKFTKNLSLATWRASYFSDKASASIYFDKIDGIFTQMEANAGQVITITQNAQATYALQLSTLGGEDVYNYLVAMYDLAATQPWFDDSIMEYRLTRTMSTKLVSWLNAQGDKAPMNCACIDAASAVLTRAYRVEGLTLNGIPVLTHNEFDDIINYSTELNGGGGVAARVNPHRAILTYRENILIGTSETAALNSFDIWHSKDDKKVYIEGSSYVGGGVPLVDEYVLAI